MTNKNTATENTAEAIDTVATPKAKKGFGLSLKTIGKGAAYAVGGVAAGFALYAVASALRGTVAGTVVAAAGDATAAVTEAAVDAALDTVVAAFR